MNIVIFTHNLGNWLISCVAATKHSAGLLRDHRHEAMCTQMTLMLFYVMCVLRNLFPSHKICHVHALISDLLLHS